MKQHIPALIRDPHLRSIAEKVIAAERIAPEEGLLLYQSHELPALALLASLVRQRLNGDKVFFVRNYHIEPTNKCIYHCQFCSYSEHMAGSAWEHSTDEMLAMVDALDAGVKELHITGGVHPHHGLDYYAGLLSAIREHRPELHLKAYSAIEIVQMARKARLSYRDTLRVLRDHGLGSIPGGGAEIFDEEVRRQICPDKGDTRDYLEVHAQAHRLGIPSNATMLYGHVERYAHRIDHLERLRQRYRLDPAGIAHGRPAPAKAPKSLSTDRLPEQTLLNAMRLRKARIGIDSL
ncbi:MAG TPA: radical SAM protein, partial [Bacteroidales bacterium]|nr:radical SAM protein [Bacteroidales bacterium]